jgi:hypothetical protein
LDRDSIDLLKFLHSHETQSTMPLYVSGDGILRLARLINAGLVDEGLRSAGGSYWGGAPSTNYRPSLTEIGRQLIQAWIAGDAATVRALLTGQA